jgi:hypothetical protein
VTIDERLRLGEWLNTFAAKQGQIVPGERIEQLIEDCVTCGIPCDEALHAAIEQHRLEVGHFPRIHELRARLGLGSTGARKRIDTWGRPMNSCPHAPGCRSMTACRDRILEDARAERAIAERAS